MQESFRLGNDDLDALLNTLRDYVTALQNYEDATQAYQDSSTALQAAVGLAWNQMMNCAWRGNTTGHCANSTRHIGRERQTINMSTAMKQILGLAVAAILLGGAVFLLLRGGNATKAAAEVVDENAAFKVNGDNITLTADAVKTAEIDNTEVTPANVPSS